MTYGDPASNVPFTITALAISPSPIQDQQLLVYATHKDFGFNGRLHVVDSKFKLFIVRTSDGGRVGNAISFEYQTFLYGVTSQGMVWALEDRIYMAF